MTRIAVTAASGQLGSEIVKATIEVVGKDCVIGLARTPGKAESLGIEVRPGDYDSPSDLENSLQGIDTLLIVSGMDAPEKRIGQHRNVIEAATKAGIGKIVYTRFKVLRSIPRSPRSFRATVKRKKTSATVVSSGSSVAMASTSSPM